MNKRFCCTCTAGMFRRCYLALLPHSASILHYTLDDFSLCHSHSSHHSRLHFLVLNTHRIHVYGYGTDTVHMPTKASAYLTDTFHWADESTENRWTQTRQREDVNVVGVWAKYGIWPERENVFASTSQQQHTHRHTSTSNLIKKILRQLFIIWFHETLWGRKKFTCLKFSGSMQWHRSLVPFLLLN